MNDKWALMFNFKDGGDKCEYYLRPISELTGKNKEHFLKVSARENKSEGTEYKKKYNVDMYYYSDSVYSRNYSYLYVGKKENLEKVKIVFMEHNRADTKFERALTDILKPETQKHFGDIVDNL